MNLPRLYVSGKFRKVVQPISVSITQNITPLSTAVMTLQAGEELPARSWVELFTPYGSAGMFRVRSPHDAYGEETTTAELEHMISEVGDYLVKEELSEMMAADAAMKRVFKHYGGGKWKLGSLSNLGTGKIALEAKYERVLDAMLGILEQKRDVFMDFDFTTSPWTIKFTKKSTSVNAEGRLARNVTSATISSDDTELCTRVWYQTFNSKGEGTWKYKDADTKGTYGIVEGVVRTSADMTTDEINATVNAYLNDHKKPRTNVSIQGVELYKITSVGLDKMTLGKLYRLALPDYGITVEEHINNIVWNDVYGDPMDMTVNIGSEEDTVVTFLHNLDSKGRGGGGGGRAADIHLTDTKKFYTDFYKDDKRIDLIATELDDAGEILRQAGMKLNSKRVLIYATDNSKNLMSYINTQAKRIDLVVTGTGKNAKVNTAKIVAGINDQGGSYVKIKADKINLSGYVTMSEFKADHAYIDNLRNGHATIGTVTIGTCNCTRLHFGGNDVKWRQITIDGTPYWLCGR